MPMRTPEAAAIFGALDSDVFVDGHPCDADVIRTIVHNGNRLMVRGDRILNYIFDTGLTVTEAPDGGLLGWGWPVWLHVTPVLTRMKKPGLTRARLHVRFYARTGEELYIQVVTDAAAFNPSADNTSSNAVRLTGDGGWQWVTLSNIPLVYGPVEHIAIMMRGVVTTTPGVTATYGGVNTGTIDGIREHDVLQDNGAGWNTAGSIWSTGGHAVIIETAGGNQFSDPKWITQVVSSSELRLFPGFPENIDTQSYIGQTYRIRELPRWRIANLSLYAMDRVI